MQRRSVIKWLVSLTAAACAPVSALQSALAAATPRLPAADFGSAFPALGSARAVGLAYLQGLAPPDAWSALSTQWLAADPRLALFVSTVTDSSRRRELAQCIRADFVGGRTASVQGWVLSDTEAKVCALLHLQAP